MSGCAGQPPMKPGKPQVAVPLPQSLLASVNAFAIAVDCSVKNSSQL